MNIHMDAIKYKVTHIVTRGGPEPPAGRSSRTWQLFWSLPVRNRVACNVKRVGVNQSPYSCPGTSPSSFYCPRSCSEIELCISISFCSPSHVTWVWAYISIDICSITGVNKPLLYQHRITCIYQGNQAINRAEPTWAWVYLHHLHHCMQEIKSSSSIKVWITKGSCSTNLWQQHISSISEVEIVIWRLSCHLR